MRAFSFVSRSSARSRGAAESMRASAAVYIAQSSSGSRKKQQERRALRRLAGRTIGRARHTTRANGFFEYCAILQTAAPFVFSQSSLSHTHLTHLVARLLRQRYDARRCSRPAHGALRFTAKHARRSVIGVTFIAGTAAAARHEVACTVSTNKPPIIC